MADGARWVEQRRFSLHTLRDFGFGRFAMEDAIRAELSDLCAALSSSSTSDSVGPSPIDPSPLLLRAVANVICALVFGARLGGIDPHFDRAADFINKELIPKQRVWRFLLAKYVRFE